MNMMFILQHYLIEFYVLAVKIFQSHPQLTATLYKEVYLTLHSYDYLVFGSFFNCK